MQTVVADTNDVFNPNMYILLTTFVYIRQHTHAPTDVWLLMPTSAYNEN